MLEKFTILFLLLATSAWASNLTPTPTPIQQFLQIPEYNQLLIKSWHIGEDIIGFYGLTEELYVDKNKPEGYLRISPKTSQVQRILDDTIASCHQGISLLDRSYYNASISTFLYYCVANNSLLLIDTKDYKVQDAIPISTSQTFKEVILGRDEQGHVSILGLPNILHLPAQAPTELILVDITTKSVQTHVIFNKDTDSQKLVTGFAVDSGVSYLLTKAAQNDNTLIEIHQISLTENDYELTPFTQFTYQKENIVHVVHNPLNIIDGHLFTNDYNNLLVFDKKGTLVLNETNLEVYPCKKTFDSATLWAPTIVAQEGGQAFYAYFLGMTVKAYSVKNGVLTSTLIDSNSYGMKIAVGDSDLLISMGINTFSIKEIQTNTTIYTSMVDYEKMMVSSSYISFLSYKTLYVFDRQVTGKLLQTFTVPVYSFHDPFTNILFGLSPVDGHCQINYFDLETLNVRTGPLIKNQKSCDWNTVYVDLTDLASPFFVVDVSTKMTFGYLLVSPATYGVISWTAPARVSYDKGVIVPGDAGTSFSYVWADLDDKSKVIKVNSYKLNKLLKRFVLQESYNLTTVETQSGYFSLVPIFNNRIVMTYDKKITILDLTQRNAVDYDVPTWYRQPSGVKVLYDKNKTPYLSLSEVTNFGQLTTIPQLFDFTSFVPVPGAIANLTRTAIVIDNCRYSLIDESNDNIGIIRILDNCNSAQTSQIYI